MQTGFMKLANTVQGFMHTHLTVYNIPKINQISGLASVGLLSNVRLQIRKVLVL